MRVLLEPSVLDKSTLSSGDPASLPKNGSNFKTTAQTMMMNFEPFLSKGRWCLVPLGRACGHRDD
jgi:hypothetical protein